MSDAPHHPTRLPGGASVRDGGRQDSSPRAETDRDAHTPSGGSSESELPAGEARQVSPDDARRALDAVRHEVAKAVVGQDAALSALLVALVSRGHVLLEGVPGVAKTLLVRSLASALAVDMKRVQFTPDLMPGDITGSMLFDAAASRFEFRSGPVFTNLLLADEINRTPPKTQAALLEAMAERQVTVDGRTMALPEPFLVAATQNPIEFDGTYTLPEAQLDRFLMRIELPLPERDAEIEVLRRHAAGFDPSRLASAGIRAVAGPEHVAAASRAVESVRVEPDVAGYVVDIARATRASTAVRLGVSPRGAAALMSVSRSWAWLTGRDFVTPDDVRSLAQVTLAHRIVLRSEAEMDGLDAAGVLASAVQGVPVPR